jgi:DHA2 family multidrug resistance protein
MQEDNEINVNKWLVALSVLTGTLMSAINTSSVNVALPYIQGTIAASTTETTWIVASYLLANVIVMPIVALLCQKFGRKNFYQFSSLIFSISSIACGFCDSLVSLIIWRILQGLGGGVLVPLAQSIMRETFPPEQHGTAMGIYGLGVVLGPALGPTLGGYITDAYSWRWVFFMNVPIGILNILLVHFFIFDPPYFKKSKVKIDYLGLSFMVIGLGALQIMLEKGAEENWFESTFIQRLAITAIIGLIIFVIIELKVKNPSVNLRILKNVNLAVGTFFSGIIGVGLYGSLFVLPRFLQELMGYDAFKSGVALLPRAMAMFITMPIAGFMYNRFRTKLIFVGMIITSISFFMLSHLNLSIDFRAIFLPQFLQGIGYGLIFVPLSTTALITIEKHLLTSATGLYNVVRQVAGSIGTAIAATVISDETGRNFYRVQIVHNLNINNYLLWDWLDNAFDALYHNGSSAYLSSQRAYKLLWDMVNEQSSMLAYNKIFYIMLMLFLISLPCLLLFRKSKKLNIGSQNENK